MRIMIFINSLAAGGAERVATVLAHHWAQKNYEITIVTLEGEERDFYRQHAAIKRVALRLSGESRGPVDAVLANLRRIYALRRQLKKLRPDILIGVMDSANVIGIIASTGIPLKFIASEHTYPPRLPLGRSWEALRRWTYRWADVVTAPSEKIITWLRKNTSSNCTKVIPNPIPWPLPVQNPIYKPDSIISPDRKVVLGMGRLVHSKGFDLLIDAFTRISKQYPNWDLVILGEGPERNTLKSQSKNLGIAERFHLVGQVGNVGHWYERAEIYVMSSRFEGFGNTLVEALASGCPCLSFNCEWGPAEIVRHEVDGLLVPPEDVEALANSLAKLMSSISLRRKFAETAIQTRARFSVHRIGAMWDELLGVGDLQ